MGGPSSSVPVAARVAYPDGAWRSARAPDRPAVRRAQRLYLGSAIAMALPTAALLAAGPVSLSPTLWLSIGSKLAFVAVPAVYMAVVRRARHRLRPALARWVDHLSDVAALVCAWTAVPLLGLVASAVLTPWCLGDADPWLAAPEQAVGVTQRDLWLRFEAWGAIGALDALYGSVRYQVWFAFLFGALVARDLRAFWEFVALLMFTAAVGMCGYWLAPAVGPHTFFAYGDEAAAPSFLADWMRLRSGAPVTLDRLDGYIGFPSFHVVFAVLLTWLWRGTPWVWPAAALNAGVIVATWVVGWHYLTDLVGGALLVTGCLLAWARWLGADPAG